jgi:hypothetical protein
MPATRAKPLGVGVGEPREAGSPPPPKGVAFTPTTSNGKQSVAFVGEYEVGTARFFGRVPNLNLRNPARPSALEPR